MNDFDRKRLTNSFEMIKKISMERAKILDEAHPVDCCIALLFSMFIQMFIDYHPSENRTVKFDEFIEIGKETIEKSIRNEKK